MENTQRIAIKQEFLTYTNKEISRLIVEAFVDANIPLEKLNNVKLKRLFGILNVKLPSESSARRELNFLAEQQYSYLKAFFGGKKYFLIVDESDIRTNKYMNILWGDIEQPTDYKVLDCIQLTESLSQHNTKIYIDITLEKYCLDKGNFILLLSDAARYMTAVGNR